MRLYYILTKLFSFELKNTNKINIRNYKYVPIKCNKNDKYSKVLFGPHWSILPTLVLFSPHFIRSNLSTWSYLVDIGPIRSTMVLFVPTQSTLVHSVLFGPCCSHSVLFCPFGPLCSIWSICVHFGPFRPLWFILVHFGPFLYTNI